MIRRRRPSILVAALVVLASAGAGCGDDESPTSAPADCDAIVDGEVTLVAEDLKWSTDCLRVEVGTTITVTVDNRDRGVQHNLAIGGPSGEERTDIVPGPTTQTLVYEATDPGPHPFDCEPHATTMKGTLWVEAP